MSGNNEKSFIRGYSMLLHSLLMWMFFIATASTGLNILIPGFAAKNALDATGLLSVNTIAALIAVFVSIGINRVAMAYGVKLVTIISLFVGGIIGMLGLGVVSSVAGFTVCAIAAQCACNGYSNSVTNNLITNWFPRTRGRMLGITTCGVPLAVLLVIPQLSKLMAQPGGFDKVVFAMGATLTVVGVISIFWMKNKPEDCGLYPDNKPFTEEEKKSRLLARASAVEWSWGSILKNRTAWLIIVAFGLFYIACTGFSAQMVPYLIEFGYTQPEAVGIMGRTAFFGLAGSILSGVIDSRFGTKISCVIYAVLTTVGFLVLFISHDRAFILACVFIQATTMGAVANLIPSIIMQCFGRDSFISVNRIIFPGIFLLRSFCYAMVAWGVKNLGGYINTYAAFGIMCLAATAVLLLINTKKVQEPEGA
ncbi:MAG: MFS transporter [Lachnospiraceae bacterium]|jgi:MFS family permease|nr:MFS transporter [Lachnospiraceae bacterium]